MLVYPSTLKPEPVRFSRTSMNYVAIARQRRNKHFSEASNKNARMEELLESEIGDRRRWLVFFELHC
jgi:hypothetical protein